LVAILSLLLGAVVIWLIGANIMYGVLCRYAIDGLIELGRRGATDAYIQSCVDDHHEHIRRRVLLWPFTAIGIAIGVMRARAGKT